MSCIFGIIIPEEGNLPFVQLRGSTRSSFSARYFARSNSQLSRLALFQSSPPGSTVSINKGTRALLLDNLDTATTRGQLLIDDQKKHCEPHTQQVDIEQLWTVLACLRGCGL